MDLVAITIALEQPNLSPKKRKDKHIVVPT